MEDRIEDKMFLKAIEQLGLKKSLYIRADFPHQCTMCRDTQIKFSYKLKPELVTSSDQPYIFICDECYKELPD